MLAVAAEDPATAARDVARRLANDGVRGLAAALGPDGSVALAAPRLGTGGATRVLLVPPAHIPPLVRQQLDALRPNPRDTALTHALRVAELFDTEVAGERFFTAFRVMLERMAGSLDERYTMRDRRMATLLALTRVLFLYFVQAKGWLDGRSDYLRALLDTTLARRRHFHRSALHPLFFGTLNRPRDGRGRHVPPGDVPYLNGGLFETHPVERRIGPVLFSNALWRDAFDHLFEHFRFCLREADEVNAIAPDMLGRVFERLMDGGERHTTGSFYTPEGVVRHVVDATLETALAGVGGLAPDTARRLVKCASLPVGARSAARVALQRLRLLDPAVGSGAFLLGALHSLTEMHLSLRRRGHARDRWRVRYALLRDNLFGVDLNPMAVRLAELRLWLAVVADDPTRDLAAVRPLPNLDGVVRQGDSLLDPLGLAAGQLGGSAPPPDQQRAVREARRALFDRRGRDRRAAIEALRAAESVLARSVIARGIRGAEHEIADLAAGAASRDLFGGRAGLTAEQRRHHRALKRTRHELMKLLAALDDGGVPAFSFESHVPDVMSVGGFSVVVGNPPWVRAERLAPARRQLLGQRFSWWHAAGRRGFRHLPDLCVAFLQRALELTAEGGAVGMLLPSKVTTAAYGEAARAHLVRETTITCVHRVSEQDARAFGATTYPLALVVRRAPPPPGHRVRLGIGTADNLPQGSLATEGPWVLVPDRAAAALEELRAAGLPLADVARPALGVKTGADCVFVGRPVGVEDGASVVRLGDRTVRIECDALRPAVRGRDVVAFAVRLERVILWGLDDAGTPHAHLPPLAGGHVRRHRSRLERRSDFRSGPLWTVFRTRAAVQAHRVVWPDIARRPRAVLLDEVAPRAIPLNTCYVAAAPDREAALAITGVLNSTWAMALTSVRGNEARGGYRRITARVAEDLPVPPPGVHRTALAAFCARAHRAADAAREELDSTVADALGLSPGARRILRRLADDHLGRARHS